MFADLEGIFLSGVCPFYYLFGCEYVGAATICTVPE